MASSTDSIGFWLYLLFMGVKIWIWLSSYWMKILMQLLKKMKQLLEVIYVQFATKGGLRRREKSKHTEGRARWSRSKKYLIHNLQLKIIIEKAANKLSEDKCFLINDRNLFSTFNIIYNFLQYFQISRRAILKSFTLNLLARKTYFQQAFSSIVSFVVLWNC